MPKWNEFVSWVFFGLMAFCAYTLTSTVGKMNDSISELNKNVAVVMFQISDLYTKVKDR